MYFGKKFKIVFRNLDEVTVDCINNIKSIIIERRDIGHGNVCGISGGNQRITKIDEVINLDKGFQFVLNADSENHLYELVDLIKNSFIELNFKYYLEEMIPGAELSVENRMGIHESLFNEIVTKKRDFGSAIVGSSIFHLVGGSNRNEYIAVATIRFRCELKDVNVILNEIISDFTDKGFEINVEFV